MASTSKSVGTSNNNENSSTKSRSSYSEELSSEPNFIDGGILSSSQFSGSNTSSRRENFSMRVDINTFDDAAIIPSHERSKDLKLKELGFDKFKPLSSLYGRDKEISILNESLLRVSCGTNDHQHGHHREFVFISGKSGVGKSAMALNLKDAVEKRHKGIYLSGKYDLNQRNKPFSAVSVICCQFCWKIEALRSIESLPTSEGVFSFEDARQNILNHVDSTELRLLTNLVPDLEGLVGEDALSETNIGDQKGKMVKDRLLYAFQKFFHVINELFSPLVIVVDDLQWADMLSLEFIKSLSDCKIPKLLMIGCYRSNEVDQNHILFKTIRDLKSEAVKNATRITEISIGNLDLQAVTGIIMDMLNLSDRPRCEGLARVCLKRTEGNVFFLLSFIEMLKAEKLIEFQVSRLSWDWDLGKVDQETSAATNVVDLVVEKMKKVDEEVSIILRLAACLGNEFPKQTLFLVWTKYSSSSNGDDVNNTAAASDRNCFERLLLSLLEQRFLECDGASMCRFVHGKISEAASAMSSNEEFETLQEKVGTILFENLSDEELEASIFVVASLQSNAREASSRIASLNLRAAVKAQGLSAFESSSAYVASGIAFLPEDAWTSNQKLAIELYSVGAEVNCCLGSFDKAEAYCEEALEQETVTIFDKAKFYNVRVKIKRGMGHNKESQDLSLEILNLMGCNIPTDSFKLRVDALYDSFRIPKPPTKDQMDALPLVSDPQTINRMNLMMAACLDAYRTGNDRLWILLTLRVFRWTLQHGLVGSTSAMAFVALGLKFHILGDFKTMREYDELALAIVDRFPQNVDNTYALYVAYSYGLAWVKPVRSTFRTMLDAYKKAMQVGNTETAMRCVSCYIWLSFWAGRSLGVVESDCAMYSQQMHALKRLDSLEWLILYNRTIQNLMGLSDDIVQITGQDEEEYLKNAKSPAMTGVILRCLKVALCAYFGDYKTGSHLSIAKGDEYLEKYQAVPVGMFDAFHRGVCLYATARTTRKRLFKIHARKVHAQVRSWTKKGNPNSVHHLKFLDAEYSALRGRRQETYVLYQQAIVLAAQGGFVNDAGLASERYATTLLESVGDEIEREAGRYRMAEAIKYYREWGGERRLKC